MLSKFKRAVVCAAAPLAIAAPLLVTAPAADAYAGTPGCVTLTEFRSVTNGMSQLQVARRFGTYAHPYWGATTWIYDSGDEFSEIDREWRRCNSAGQPVSTWNGSVEVDFTGVPLRSSYKIRSVY
jgi:hypothetical protein